MISWLLTMAEGSIYGVVRKIDLRPVRLELKCGFRILTQVVDILFLRRRTLYPAELRAHVKHGVFTVIYSITILL